MYGVCAIRIGVSLFARGQAVRALQLGLGLETGKGLVPFYLKSDKYLCLDAVLTVCIRSCCMTLGCIYAIRTHESEINTE